MTVPIGSRGIIALVPVWSRISSGSGVVMVEIKETSVKGICSMLWVVGRDGDDGADSSSS